jgi:type II secretion system protein H
MANNRSQASRGVTLIEMMVVLAIVSVSLAVIAPSARAGIAGIKVRSAARKVAALLGGARNQAIRERRVLVLTIDRQAGVLQVAQAGGSVVRQMELDDDVTIRLAGDGEDATPAGEPSAGSTTPLVFMPDGGVPELKLELRSARRVVRLSMDSLTGSLSASEAE